VGVASAATASVAGHPPRSSSIYEETEGDGTNKNKLNICLRKKTVKPVRGIKLDKSLPIYLMYVRVELVFPITCRQSSYI
jgi:hypothetical protein